MRSNAEKSSGFIFGMCYNGPIQRKLGDEHGQKEKEIIR